MRLIAITCTLVAAGCVTPPMDVSDGGAPTTGIYRLSETRSGDCQTLQPDDTIDAYVVADGTSWLLDLSAPWFGNPSAALGPALIVEPNGGSELDDPICSGVVDHRAFTVELATPITCACASSTPSATSPMVARTARPAACPWPTARRPPSSTTCSSSRALRAASSRRQCCAVAAESRMLGGG